MVLNALVKAFGLVPCMRKFLGGGEGVGKKKVLLPLVQGVRIFWAFGH